MTDDAQKIATIDPNHTVALFTPETGTLKQAASAGAKSLVNFRADGEKGGLTPDEEREQAERLGLNYLHHPVTADSLDAALVDDFRRSLDDLPQPVFLHCASGKRAGAMTLMALAADKGWDGDTALQEGKARGIDLTEEKIGQFVKSYADEKANA
ncbi:beta-lactamase hydrolase domain-containing protein [Sulfitobacter delicatus]|uniref:TIGR01244 family protein n=1 Tax=Sulfitobacter delicatus TaxID=218672 RepID=A0A1G7UMC1_9RHOB|nr:sulfur transferase domain-containing protein [Sulfitobacter delicatus]SDG48249.1 TIGR01244 family protein [Sulfitobacter delicatus]